MTCPKCGDKLAALQTKCPRCAPNDAPSNSAGQDLLELWKSAGFDCMETEPDVLVFQPNTRHARDQVKPLLGIALFLSLWGAMPMVMWLSEVGLTSLNLGFHRFGSEGVSHHPAFCPRPRPACYRPSCAVLYGVCLQLKDGRKFPL